MTRRTLAAIAALTLAISGCVGEQPEPFDVGVDRVPVVNDEGEQVGTIPEGAIDEVAGGGERVEVLDEQGDQIGWWTESGFEPLDDAES